MTHQLLRRPQVYQIGLIGAGGTGSRVLAGLSDIAISLPHLANCQIDVTVIDHDTVSTANIGRQPFTEQDVGLKKADVLVQRYNQWFGLAFKSITDKATVRTQLPFDMVITCVDSAAARREVGLALRTMYTTKVPRYWLDCGNKAVTGQVVLGEVLRQNHRDWHGRLPTVLELYPSLADPNIPEDDAPSCSLAEALQKQDLFINRAVALQACSMVWQLLSRGEISYNAAWIDQARGKVRTMEANPEVWKRFGHRGARKPPQKKNIAATA